MNDTLVSQLNKAEELVSTAASNLVGRGMADRAEQHVRSFAEVANEVMVQSETKETERSEEAGDPDWESLEELAAMTIPLHWRARIPFTQPEPEVSPDGLGPKAALDAGEITEISIDKEVSYTALRPPKEVVGRDYSVAETDKGSPEIVITQMGAKLREVLSEAAQNVDTPPDISGAKDLSASSIDMSARLSVLSQRITIQKSRAEAPLHASLQDMPEQAGPIKAAPAVASAADTDMGTTDTDTDTDTHADWLSADRQGAATMPEPPRTTKPIPARGNQESLYLMAQKIENADMQMQSRGVSDTASQIIRQIVETTAVSQGGNISQIRLQLNPEFLGKVSIVLTAAEDGLTARIQTQSGVVREMLESNLFRLESDLRDMGINMKSIEISQPGLTGHMTPGGHDGRFFGRNEYESPDTVKPITMARFRQAIQNPEILYAGLRQDRYNPYMVADEGGFDFWA